MNNQSIHLFINDDKYESSSSKINDDFFSDIKDNTNLIKEIKTIIKNEKYLFNQINGKDYPTIIFKYYTEIEKPENSYNIYIYFLPKFSSKQEKLFLINENNEKTKELMENNLEDNNQLNQSSDIKIVNEEFYEYKTYFDNFLNEAKEILNNKDNKINKTSIKNQFSDKINKNSYLFDLYNDYNLLKGILVKCKNLKLSKETKTIYSDMIIGEINYDLNVFNNDFSVIAQTIKVNNNNLYKIVNSYLKAKFNSSYLNFLNKNKNNNEFKIMNNILKVYEQIKTLTKYEKTKIFVPKERLKSFIMESRNKEIYKKNVFLFKDLEKLLLNIVSYDKKYNYKRETLPMDKIWEYKVGKYLEKIYNGHEIKEQEEKQYFYGHSLKENIKKSSIPDFIVLSKEDNQNEIIIDAKYKIFNQKYMAEDYNKLLRDMITHNSKKGLLIYVKKENNNNDIEKIINTIQNNYFGNEISIDVIILPFTF